MQQIGLPELVLLGTVAALLLWGSKIPVAALKLREALDNFRGGPGSPSHPIPANDSRLLNRKRDTSDKKHNSSPR
jgi:Sec-independent protein translocase protein TatA